MLPRCSGDRTVFLFDRRLEQADPDEKVLSYGKDNYRGFRSAVCQVLAAGMEGRREGRKASAAAGRAAALTPLRPAGGGAPEGRPNAANDSTRRGSTCEGRREGGPLGGRGVCVWEEQGGTRCFLLLPPEG